MYVPTTHLADVIRTLAAVVGTDMVAGKVVAAPAGLLASHHTETTDVPITLLSDTRLHPHLATEE